MKIVTVVGARPQFIKAAALSRAISQRNDIQEIIVHTGQHFDENMSDIFFNQMGIPRPDYRFNINGLNHGAMTGQMLEAIEEVLVKEQPDFLLVYGDTNSTLAGALAAKKLHIKVVHVEAGLRSFNMKMPEEINRILTDRISDVLFCPTQTAIDNLEKEGFDNFDCEIHNTGDIMYDSMLLFQQQAEAVGTFSAQFKNKQFAICTIHRAENTDDEIKLKGIVNALNAISEHFEVVTPLHPRTRAKLASMGLELKTTVTDPLGYFDMLNLLKYCSLVLTDSGGLQKEAYFNNKYCITLREQTEWVELTENGYNTLVGTDTEKILSAFEQYRHSVFNNRHHLYGDGNCADLILNSLTQHQKTHN
ncbi:MAG: UDP-N-acetylglucosamine 2-epimerase (non-hydrolyzing) [Bacteroidota bacterium]